MTMIEFLEQGRRLNERINSRLRELQELRAAICLPASGFPDGIGAGRVRQEEAGFARALERICRIEEEINREIDCLADLKEEIREVIRGAGRAEYQLVLTYRYVENLRWRQICGELSCSLSTAKRWHREALAVLPATKE